MTQSDSKHDFPIRLLIVGDQVTGKNMLMERFTNGTYTEESLGTTCTCNMKSRTVQLDGVRCQVQVFVPNSRERFQAVVPMFYRSAMGIIFAYSVTDEMSLPNIDKW